MKHKIFTSLSLLLMIVREGRGGTELARISCSYFLLALIVSEWAKAEKRRREK